MISDVGFLKIKIPVVVTRTTPDGMFTAYCPALEITTCGVSMQDSLKKFKSALKSFIDQGQKNKLLKNDLQQLGWLFDPSEEPVLRPPLFMIGRHRIQPGAMVVLKTVKIPRMIMTFISSCVMLHPG